MSKRTNDEISAGVASKLDKSLGEIIGTYCRIFVGGLRKNVDDSELESFFEEYGEIESAKVMHDKKGVSRGFGFIHFKDKSAWEAIKGKHLKIAGRPIDVKLARTTEQLADSSRIFVGGLNYYTTDEHFLDVFSKFGEIQDAEIMRTSDGDSRGFGFVTFAQSASFDKLLDSLPLRIDGRKCEIRAARGRSDNNSVADHLKTRKIFVGGLPQDCDEESLEEYFSQFGSVSYAEVKYDNKTKNSRGFGYVTFDSWKGIEQIIAKGGHVVCGRKIEVKKAVPKRMMYEDEDNDTFKQKKFRRKPKKKIYSADFASNQDDMFNNPMMSMMGFNPRMAAAMFQKMADQMRQMDNGYGKQGGRRGRRGRRRGKPY